jgi:hypothetical protein
MQWGFERALMVVTALRILRAEPSQRSLLAQSIWTRLAVTVGGLALFWLAIVWAVAVP